MIPFIQKKSFNYPLFSKYIDSAVETNQWSNYGWAVGELEKRAKKLLKISDDKAVIAVNSGTSAINCIVYALRKDHGENLRVTTQDFTFPSNGIGACEGPIVVDLDTDCFINFRDDYLIDYGHIIIVTNCFGHTQPLEQIQEVCDRYDKILIYDNAATPYSFVNGSNACNFGVASYVSLHHTKPLGFGEGGLVIIDKEHENSCRQATRFGKDSAEDPHSEYAGNFKISELGAAGILQWWDQINIDEMKDKYLENYYKLQYKFIRDGLGEVFQNTADEFFPFCFPLLAFDSHKNPFENIEFKKYYKPLRNLPISSLVYERIQCYPVHGDIEEYA